MQPISPPSSDKSDLLLVNPRAGGGRAAAALFALREFAHRRGWTVDIIVTQTPNDLAREACRAAESGQKRIFVLGADGTFQLLVNAVAGYPQTILGVIPAGTGNDLAAALACLQIPFKPRRFFCRAPSANSTLLGSALRRGTSVFTRAVGELVWTQKRRNMRMALTAAYPGVIVT